MHDDQFNAQKYYSHPSSRSSGVCNQYGAFEESIFAFKISSDFVFMIQ